MFTVGTNGILNIPEVGRIEATVISRVTDGARLLLAPNAEANEALIQRFYTEGGAPNVESVRMGPVLRDLARRLSFSRRP